MRLVVTGALGHIGSRLIHGLRPGAFEEVVLLDNLSTQRFCSLFNLPAGVPFRFVEGDVCTYDLARLFAGADVVVHLAAVTNAEGSFEIQERVEQVNFTGTQRVAEACVGAGARLVFLSTTSVYGPQSEVVDEECGQEALKPQSPYAESKMRADELLRRMAAEQALRVFIGRFGTICGTSIGMRFHTAVNRFCWQACMGEPLSVWRTALHQRRPYLELGDAVRAIEFVSANDLFDGRVYNVVTENSTVGAIVDEIRRHAADVRVQFVDSAVMNQLSYTVRAERIRAEGFEFTGSLAEGIAETMTLLRAIRAGDWTGGLLS